MKKTAISRLGIISVCAMTLMPIATPVISSSTNTVLAAKKHKSSHKATHKKAAKKSSSKRNSSKKTTARKSNSRKATSHKKAPAKKKASKKNTLTVQSTQGKFKKAKTVTLKHNAYAYNVSGKNVATAYVDKNKHHYDILAKNKKNATKVKVVGYKIINGKPYYEVQGNYKTHSKYSGKKLKTYYIKASNTTTSITPKVAKAGVGSNNDLLGSPNMDGKSQVPAKTAMSTFSPNESSNTTSSNNNDAAYVVKKDTPVKVIDNKGHLKDVNKATSYYPISNTVVDHTANIKKYSEKVGNDEFQTTEMDIYYKKPANLKSGEAYPVSSHSKSRDDDSYSIITTYSDGTKRGHALASPPARVFTKETTKTDKDGNKIITRTEYSQVGSHVKVGPVRTVIIRKNGNIDAQKNILDVSKVQNDKAASKTNLTDIREPLSINSAITPVKPILVMPNKHATEVNTIGSAPVKSTNTIKTNSGKTSVINYQNGQAKVIKDHNDGTVTQTVMPKKATPVAVETDNGTKTYTSIPRLEHLVGDSTIIEPEHLVNAQGEWVDQKAYNEYQIKLVKLARQQKDEHANKAIDLINQIQKLRLEAQDESDYVTDMASDVQDSLTTIKGVQEVPEMKHVLGDTTITEPAHKVDQNGQWTDQVAYNKYQNEIKTISRAQIKHHREKALSLEQKAQQLAISAKRESLLMQSVPDDLYEGYSLDGSTANYGIPGIGNTLTKGTTLDSKKLALVDGHPGFKVTKDGQDLFVPLMSGFNINKNK